MKGAGLNLVGRRPLLYRAVRLAMRILRRPCQEIGDHAEAGDLYMTRWTLMVDGDGRKIMLHYFHRSDYDGALHDHPWPFVSFILWPGYFEHTVGPIGHPFRSRTGSARCDWCLDGMVNSPAFDPVYCRRPERDHETTRTWHGPGSRLEREARHAHRVELMQGRGCWTLVFTGRHERGWGFWCRRGWRHWREFDTLNVAGRDGCE
jgi:hypothetical protein